MPFTRTRETNDEGSSQTTLKRHSLFTINYLLDDKHAVAVAIEAVARADGVAVCVEHEFASREGAHQDEERRARQVKVGEHCVHGAEAIAGRDGESCLAAARAYATAFARGGFERAHGRRADGDYATAAR